MRYNFDWRIGKWGAVIVKGDYKVGAKELMRRLENSGWKKTEVKWGTIMVYDSSDNKWRINIRTISSSRGEFENYGYNIEATVDIINLTLPKGAGGRQREIKFILLNK